MSESDRAKHLLQEIINAIENISITGSGGGLTDAELRATPVPVSTPSDPFGANADAIVSAGAAGSIQAKLRRATQGLEDLKSLIVLAAGDNNIGNVDIVTVPSDPFGANSDAAVAAGATGSIQAKLRRATQGLEDLKTLIVLAAGTNLIGDVDIQPRATGGWSVGNFTSGDTYTALTNSAQAIKASAGKFGGYYIYNPNSSAVYVMIYNIAAASVTVGTSTAKLVFCIPAQSAANLELLAGIPFDTALSLAAATTGGGNGAPSSALEALIFYK